MNVNLFRYGFAFAISWRTGAWYLSNRGGASGQELPLSCVQIERREDRPADRPQ
jgi:hypothetical protein